MSKKLDGAQIVGFFQRRQRPYTLMWRGAVQVDKHDFWVLIIDHIRESGGVGKLDDIDILPPQFLGQVLPKRKIFIHYEAQRLRRFAGCAVKRSCCFCLGHDRIP